MGYDNEGLLMHFVSGVDVTGDLDPAVPIEASRFVAPFDMVLVDMNFIATTALTTDEVVSILVGTEADPNAYGTQVITNALDNTPMITGFTPTTETDNATIRTIIPAGTNIVVSPENDGAAAAGVGNVTLIFRALGNSEY
jgi:hypothetical protein